MNYKALIFDMDGTLLDTLSGIIKACNETFKEFGYKVEFTNEDGKYFIGAGAAEFARRALARANIKGLDLMEFRNAFLKNYSIYQKTGTKAFDGLEELVIDLQKDGYIVGICSNKPQALLDEVTKQMFPRATFDIVVGQRVGVPCKPEPKMFEIVKNDLNLNEREILYIGDSEYDYEFAKNSHADCCIVKYGYGMYDKEFMNNVTYNVSSVDELRELLRR